MTKKAKEQLLDFVIKSPDLEERIRRTLTSSSHSSAAVRAPMKPVEEQKVAPTVDSMEMDFDAPSEKHAGITESKSQV